MREEERTILQYYKIDPAYFAEKYNIPITGERGSQGDLPDDTEEKKTKKEQLAHGDDFFA